MATRMQECLPLGVTLLFNQLNLKNMKIFNYILLTGLLMGSLACDLDEVPPSLSRESLYSNVNNAKGAMDGAYAGLAAYHYYGNSFHFLTNCHSGFFVSGRGNSSKSNDNVTISSLQLTSGYNDLENVWEAIYQAIARNNEIIDALDAVEIPDNDEEIGMNEVLGQAYFLRAFHYFNLVRLWGNVPLKIALTSKENVQQSTSQSKDVYDQIIADAKEAQALMTGYFGVGYPKQYAVDMLLAKVYMTLATADVSLQDATLDYWQLAYDEAIKVYGQYSLVSNYGDLWSDLGENSVESIFEIQFNYTGSSNFIKFFTAPNAINTATWGRVKINPEVYDRHAADYPTDPRIEGTYLGSYMNNNTNSNGFGKLRANYPDNTKRTNFAQGFPYLLKYASKDSLQNTDLGEQNFIVYRYADLLLMLAEISNELGNPDGNQYNYVKEVLDRVGVIPRAALQVGSNQDDFRAAIMDEYSYELLGESQDWFNNRRRGYAYFQTEVIQAHNNSSVFDENVDVILLDNDESVMSLPIPQTEIDNNQEID